MPASRSSVNMRRYKTLVGYDAYDVLKFSKHRTALTNINAVGTYAELHVTHCLRTLGPGD
jgi:hypothetical protein